MVDVTGTFQKLSHNPAAPVGGVILQEVADFLHAWNAPRQVEIDTPQKRGIVRRRTRRVGRFDYRVMLPSQVNADGIQARMKEGVLTVRVPKVEQSRRRIEVAADS